MAFKSEKLRDYISLYDNYRKIRTYTKKGSKVINLKGSLESYIAIVFLPTV